MGVRVEAVVIFDQSGGHRFRYWEESTAVPGEDAPVVAEDPSTAPHDEDGSAGPDGGGVGAEAIQSGRPGVHRGCVGRRLGAMPTQIRTAIETDECERRLDALEKSR